MSDIFSLKTVQITPELGMALKNFRIKHEITAKSITNEFSKSSSYITKLEKGEIKKVEGAFLIKLCNYITQRKDGLTSFLSKLGRDYESYSHETQIIINNIDDLLVEHKITLQFISEINTYMENHDISIEQLINKINANEDIVDRPEFKNAPINEWFPYISDNDIPRSLIKLDIPLSYIENFLSYKIDSIHYVIGEAILYALYRLGNEEDPSILANDKLQINNIQHYCRSNFLTFNDDIMESLFGGLQPETAEALQDIMSALKLVTSVTQENEYGPKRIKQIRSNLQTDLGFTFAYLSLNLEGLSSKSKSQKSKFLDDLKLLIQKYEQSDIGLDIYE